MDVEHDTKRHTPFGPVRVPTAAQLFAEHLRTKIFNGEYKSGDHLPPERVLVEQGGLTRAAVRDALAILKQQGLIVTLTGRHGGSVVSRPTQQDLITSLDVFLQAQGWGPETPTLTESREIIEPSCAALAAQRRTTAELDAIHLFQDRQAHSLDNIPEYLSASQAWHVAVSDASHNTLLAAFMHATAEVLMAATNSARFSSHESRLCSLTAHREITEAIADRNSGRARELMTQHIRGSEDQN
ncbi:FCD domain-containing protein (plasmid) [Rhodococcus opacus]|uniref:FadR/GntR family transcriptional regulator n=1 Tax=Rhodococcus opacus TaxID=37919 RepID=UPI0034D28701